MSEQQVVKQLDPKSIIAEGNIRFGLIPGKVESLAESITDLGGVQEPVTVTADKGGKYRLVKGFYRHAAVVKLNANGAGLTLPAIEVEPMDETVKARLQLAENVNRAAMSPMDIAQAIDTMLNSGVSRGEIRAMFPRPGGRKGGAEQPASNAWVNIMHSLLSLPKGIQTKVHEGLVAPTAAYRLAKVPADKRETVLKRAEDEVRGQWEEEEKDETKFIDAEKKAAKEAQAAEQAKAAMADAKKAVTVCKGLVDEARKGLKAAQTVAYDATDAAAKKAWKESVSAAETNVKGAEKVYKESTATLAKLLAESKPKEAPAKAAKKTVGPSDIDRAAKAEGGEVWVPLKAPAIRDGLQELAKDKHAGVAAIGQALLRLCSGELTPKMVKGELEAVLDRKPQAVPVKATKVKK